jgi:hypothetical protein
MSRRRDNRSEPSTVDKETPRTMPKRTHRKIRNLAAKSLGLAATLLALTAAAASAAPEFEVAVDNDANEAQTVAIKADGGKFTLGFEGEQTGEIEVEASDNEVEEALNELPTIEAGGGSVSVNRYSAGPGEPESYGVSFDGGPLAHADVPQLSAASGTVAPLTGAPPRPSIAVYTVRPAAPSHSDERVDYTVEVRNSAPELSGVPSEGDQLSCSTKDGDWLGANVNYSFEFMWVRDGAPVTSWEPGADTGEGAIAAYTVQEEDKEHALQCLVKATNGAGSGSFVLTSQPVTAVEPLPAIAPPEPNSPTANNRRPVIENPGLGGARAAKEAGEMLKCTAPTEWTGAESWSFEWIRDGEPAEGTVTPVSATESEYELTAADVSAPAAPAVFQCIAKATNAGPAAALVDSLAVFTESPAPEFVFGGEDEKPRPGADSLPAVERADNTAIGVADLEVELPGGLGTSAYRTQGSGWSCEPVPAFGAQPAKALCARTGVLGPQQSYPPLTVIAALGADAPDAALATARASGAGAPLAGGASEFIFGPFRQFGLEAFEARALDATRADYTVAGGHPLYAEARLGLAKKRRLGTKNEGGGPADSTKYAPIEQLRKVFTDLPRGFAGNVEAIPELCPSADDVLTNECPQGSLIGRAGLVFGDGTGQFGGSNVQSVFAMEPEFGAPVQFGIPDPFGDVYTITPRLLPGDNYAITAEAAPVPPLDILEVQVDLCGFGAERVGGVIRCKEPGEEGAYAKPLLTNPTSCNQAPVTGVRLDSWPHPGEFKHYTAQAPPLTACGGPKFEPQMDLAPTSHRADSPTGMQVELSMPTDGFEQAGGIAQANLKRARVTLPEGMAVNASAAQGLGACTLDQIGFSSQGVPNDDPVRCPEASKIGSLEVETPLIDETFTGDVYLAKQSDNPFDSLLALYIVIDSPKNGILVKLAGKVDPDPHTGRLLVTFSDNPELPVSSLRLDFPQGPRSPLVNPPKCGTYRIKSELSPWNAADPNNPTPAETVTRTSTYNVDQGCTDGGLHPGFAAGVSNPLAGQTSPFNVHLTRPDGSDRFTALGLNMPPGLTAYLAGIPYCPQASIDQARSREGAGQGQVELDSPSCPAASRIGTAIAGAGAGPDPFYLDTGRLYLAGPYKGAQLSVVAIAPAVAGPFDLGTVVIRSALRVNPKTAQVSVLTDPIPTIKHGILLDVRDLRVLINRPRFTLNPTSCQPMAIAASVTGQSGAVASLANRFQVGGCANLGFKPKLNLRLYGKIRRGAFPALRALYRPRAGNANIKRLALRFPRSEFIEQGHFRTICTRAQFAAGNGLGEACPKGSVYGRVRAWTPLLSNPLEGPVFLRSSNHKLPDVVFSLRGQVSAEVSVRIDSVKGGLRATIESAPDVPVSRVLVYMQGGQKGLFVNSRNICAKTKVTNGNGKKMRRRVAKVYRANAKLNAQNSRRRTLKPKMYNKRCKKWQRKHGKGGGKKKQGKGKKQGGKKS